jgi:hypothetical protein
MSYEQPDHGQRYCDCRDDGVLRGEKWRFPIEYFHWPHPLQILFGAGSAGGNGSNCD